VVSHDETIYITEHFEDGTIIVLNICTGSMFKKIIEEETLGRIYIRELVAVNTQIKLSIII
jgi:hypothetical protein